MSFQDLNILGSGQQPGTFQGNEFSLSKHLEASCQYHSATHCVLLREFLPLSRLLFSYLQNGALGKLRSQIPLSSDVLWLGVRSFFRCVGLSAPWTVTTTLPWGGQSGGGSLSMVTWAESTTITFCLWIFLFLANKAPRAEKDLRSSALVWIPRLLSSWKFV